MTNPGRSAECFRALNRRRVDDLPWVLGRLAVVVICLGLLYFV